MIVLRINITLFLLYVNEIVGATVKPDLLNVKLDGDHVKKYNNKGESGAVEKEPRGRKTIKLLADTAFEGLGGGYAGFHGDAPNGFIHKGDTRSSPIKETTNWWKFINGHNAPYLLDLAEEKWQDGRGLKTELPVAAVGGVGDAWDGLHGTVPHGIVLPRDTGTDVGERLSGKKLIKQLADTSFWGLGDAYAGLHGAIPFGIFRKGKIDPFFNRPTNNWKANVGKNTDEGERKSSATIKMTDDALTDDIHPEPITNINIVHQVPFSSTFHTGSRYVSSAAKPHANPFSSASYSQLMPTRIEFTVPCASGFNCIPLNSEGNVNQIDRRTFEIFKKIANATLGAIRGAYEGWNEGRRKAPAININFVQSVPVSNTVNASPHFVSTVSKPHANPVSTMSYTNPVPIPDSYLRPIHFPNAYGGWKEGDRKVPTANLKQSVPIPNIFHTSPYFVPTVSNTQANPVSTMTYTNPMPIPDSYLRPFRVPGATNIKFFH